MKYNNSIDEDAFQQSPLSCTVSTCFGVYYSILIFLSLSLNSLLLWLFLKHRDLRKPANFTNISLVFADLFFTLFDLPILAVNSFNCGFSFSKPVCFMQGVVSFTIFTFTNTILVAFSFERYWMVCKPSDKRLKSRKSVLVLICGISSYCAFWVIISFFTGWMSVVKDSSKLGCNINWYMITPAQIIYYSVTLWVFLFGLPLVFIFLFNFKSIKKIKEMSKIVATTQDRSRLNRAKSLTIFTIALIACILATDVPHALHCTYVSYIQPNIQLPLVSALANAFSKAMYIVAAVINILLNRDLKRYIVVIIRGKIHPSANASAHTPHQSKCFLFSKIIK